MLAELVPEIRERTPALPELDAPGDAVQARSALFDAAVSFLRAASRSQPLLLVFDDLHWADQSSLLLTRFLARNLRDSRILILGARRDVELRSAIQVDDMLADLARESRHLALRGLSPDEVKAFIESTAGESVAGSVAAAIHRLTEGNPFFVAGLSGCPDGYNDAASIIKNASGVRQTPASTSRSSDRLSGPEHQPVS